MSLFGLYSRSFDIYRFLVKMELNFCVTKAGTKIYLHGGVKAIIKLKNFPRISPLPKNRM